MLKEFLESHLSVVIDSHTRKLDKALKLIVFFLYALTAVQLQKYIHILKVVIQPDSALGLSEEILLKFFSSILAIAGYFLLLETADFLRYCVSTIIVNLQFLFKFIFQIYSESEIERKYKYNRNIVMKHEVERYLEVNQDERVKERYEEHDKWEDKLKERKRDIMAISIILALNFYLNHEKLNLMSDYAQHYWLITIGLAIWSALLPYDNLMFMYIYDNKIRN